MKGKNLNWEDYIMFRSCFVNPTKQAETLSKKKRCKDTFSEKLSRNGTAERKDKEVKVYEGSALTPPPLFISNVVLHFKFRGSLWRT